MFFPPWIKYFLKYAFINVWDAFSVPSNLPLKLSATLSSSKALQYFTQETYLLLSLAILKRDIFQGFIRKTNNFEIR